MPEQTVAEITEEVIQSVKHRILTECRPKAIYLFGSAAAGETNPNSDLDILVVTDLPAGKSRWALAGDLYSSLVDISVPVDIIVISPEEFQEGLDLPGHVARIAAQEGRKLYE